VTISRTVQHATFLAAMDRFESVLKGKIVDDKNDFIRAAATRYAEHGAINFFDLVHKHQEQLFTTLKAITSGSSRYSGPWRSRPSTASK
jgi:hypothetical protein